MPTLTLPSTAVLLDAKVCPLGKFDALFTAITQGRRISDGYFLQTHPDGVWLLFVVNGSPYAVGQLADGQRTFHEIHEFFAAYARTPESPLSFFIADKRLLLGLMVLFQHHVARREEAPADVAAAVQALADRGQDAVLAVTDGSEWGLGLCTKGRLAAAFLPPGATASQAAEPAAQLVAYAASRLAALEVFEETRVQPAGDVMLVTPETRGRLSVVFLQAAERVREAMAAKPPEPAPPEPPVAVPPVAAPAEPAPAPLLEVVPPEPEIVFSPEALEPALGAPVPAPDVPAPAVPTPAPEAASPIELLGPSGAGQEHPEQFSNMGANAPAAPEAPAEPETLQGRIPEILVFLGEKPIGSYPLAGELTIGRTAGNTILIENAGVSRRHAVIRIQGDRAVLEDLGSSNGTLVNGERVTTRELKNGDEIGIVKHRLIYKLPKLGEAPKKVEPELDAAQKTMYIDASLIAQASAPKPSPRGESLTPVLRPRLILPDLRKIALGEGEEVTLGTSADCRIQLSGMFVGKLHARIVAEKEGQFKLIHVGGLAGTRVNGEKITEHVLKHGDEIEIGKQKLLFRLER